MSPEVYQTVEKLSSTGAFYGLALLGIFGTLFVIGIVVDIFEGFFK